MRKREAVGKESFAWIANVILLFSVGFLSCTDYTPKPRGYFRIEPGKATYKLFESSIGTYQFNVPEGIAVELPPNDANTAWVNLTYPELRATIYCDYLRITPQSLGMVMAEGRLLVSRQLKDSSPIAERFYWNPDSRVYASLFLSDGGSASPIQLLLTDSVSNFFRAALYFDCKPNADSLAPAIQYIQEDIIELIQSFNWKK